MMASCARLCLQYVSGREKYLVLLDITLQMSPTRWHSGEHASKHCHFIMDELMDSWLMLMQFDLRNGAIRKKYDSLKYTLKKMEVTRHQNLALHLPACL